MGDKIWTSRDLVRVSWTLGERRGDFVAMVEEDYLGDHDEYLDLFVPDEDKILSSSAYETVDGKPRPLCPCGALISLCRRGDLYAIVEAEDTIWDPDGASDAPEFRVEKILPTGVVPFTLLERLAALSNVAMAFGRE